MFVNSCQNPLQLSSCSYRWSLFLGDISLSSVLCQYRFWRDLYRFTTRSMTVLMQCPAWIREDHYCPISTHPTILSPCNHIVRLYQIVIWSANECVCVCLCSLFTPSLAQNGGFFSPGSSGFTKVAQLSFHCATLVLRSLNWTKAQKPKNLLSHHSLVVVCQSGIISILLQRHSKE